MQWGEALNLHHPPRLKTPIQIIWRIPAWIADHASSCDFHIHIAVCVAMHPELNRIAAHHLLQVGRIGGIQLRLPIGTEPLRNGCPGGGMVGHHNGLAWERLGQLFGQEPDGLHVLVPHEGRRCSAKHRVADFF